MKTEDMVACAYDFVQMGRCIKIFEKVGLDRKAIKKIIIGLEGIKKDLRRENEHVTRI